MSAIEFIDVSFSYGKPSEAESEGIEDYTLDHASFSIESGQFAAIIGDNGSGKSTIAKLCTGFLQPDSGFIRILDENVTNLNAKGLGNLRQKVGIVFQDPSDQFVASLVEDEVAFGPCNLGLEPKEVMRRINSALNKVGMQDFKLHNVNHLSGGQKQRIAICDALAMEPDILILDEPTSMLDANNRTLIMKLIKQLNSLGVTIVLITHDLQEAAQADVVWRVDKGRCEICDISKVTEKRHEQLEALQLRLSKIKGQTSTILHDRAIVRFEDTTFAYDDNNAPSMVGSNESQYPKTKNDVLSNLSFDVFKGEILALQGRNGSGKSTILQLMCGLLQPTSGKVTVDEITTATKEGRNHARNVVAMSFQFPELSFFNDNIFDEIAFGPQNQNKSKPEIKELVHAAMLAVGFDPKLFANRNPFSLSGGEQRRLSIACALATQPQVIALDEPFSGLDDKSHEEVLEMLVHLQKDGRTIIFVTHDKSDATLIADRTLVIDNKC